MVQVLEERDDVAAFVSCRERFHFVSCVLVSKRVVGVWFQWSPVPTPAPVTSGGTLHKYRRTRRLNTETIHYLTWAVHRDLAAPKGERGLHMPTPPLRSMINDTFLRLGCHAARCGLLFL